MRVSHRQIGLRDDDVDLTGATRSQLARVVARLAREVEGLGPIIERVLEEERGDGGDTSDGDWPALDEVTLLAADVERVLGADTSVLEWWELQELCEQGLDLADSLESLALTEEGGSDRRLFALTERALDRMVVIALEAPESESVDLLEDAVDGFVRALAAAGTARSGDLTTAQRTALADRLARLANESRVDVRVDPVAHRAALGEVGLARLRDRLARPGGEDDDGDPTWTRMRLAVALGEPAVILASFGEVRDVHGACRLVAALQEAGLGDLAIEQAAGGLRLPGAETPVGDALVDVLEADDLTGGRGLLALERRRDRFRRSPSSVRFRALREVARKLDVWPAELDDAERRLRVAAPADHLVVLLDDGRDDDAWDAARNSPDVAAASRLWPRLCGRRSLTHPAETLPIYRAEIARVLTVADVHDYYEAADLLLAMRAATERDGSEAEAGFAQFLAAVRVQHKRRSRLLSILTAAGV